MKSFKNFFFIFFIFINPFFIYANCTLTTPDITNYVNACSSAGGSSTGDIAVDPVSCSYINTLSCQYDNIVLDPNGSLDANGFPNYVDINGNIIPNDSSGNPLSDVASTFLPVFDSSNGTFLPAGTVLPNDANTTSPAVTCNSLYQDALASCDLTTHILDFNCINDIISGTPISSSSCNLKPVDTNSTNSTISDTKILSNSSNLLTQISSNTDLSNTYLNKIDMTSLSIDSKLTDISLINSNIDSSLNDIKSINSNIKLDVKRSADNSDILVTNSRITNNKLSQINSDINTSNSLLTDLYNLLSGNSASSNSFNSASSSIKNSITGFTHSDVLPTSSSYTFNPITLTLGGSTFTLLDANLFNNLPLSLISNIFLFVAAFSGVVQVFRNS